MIKYSYIKYDTYVVSQSELKVINTIKSNDTFVIVDRIENCVAVTFQSSYDRELINKMLSINTNKYSLVNTQDVPKDYVQNYIKGYLSMHIEIKKEIQDEKYDFESQIIIDKLLHEIFGSDFGIDNTGTITIFLSEQQKEELYELHLMRHIKIHGVDSIDNFQRLFLEARLRK